MMGTATPRGGVPRLLLLPPLLLPVLLPLPPPALALSDVVAGPAIPRACAPPYDSYPFCDATLDLDSRLEDLVGRLTIGEKASLLIARNSPNGTVPRLGIPEYDWGGNCLHGVQSRCADGRCPTSFPNPNALGASFNASAWRRMGEVIGLELRALWLSGAGENHQDSRPGGPALPHIGLDCWSPTVQIARDPRWGRNSEIPGEDPLLCGAFGREVTMGLQGDPGLDGRYLQAVATLKHFVGNSLEGTWGGTNGTTRHNFDARISEYDLRSTYLRPFEESIVSGGALGVMCSYNSVNGVPSCANDALLTAVLRDEWGFDGYVTTDSGAIGDIIRGHGYARDWAEAVSDAVLAGCDMESASWHDGRPWSTGGPYQDYLPMAVSRGLLDESDVDQALRRVLGLRFRLGLFDPIDDQPYWGVPISVVGSAEHARAAREATSQSLVLLKNDGSALPFEAGKRVAVIGPHANDRRAILGTYESQFCPDAYGSISCVSTVYEAIRDRNNARGGETVWAQGCEVNGTNATDMDRASALAAGADFVVFVGGLDGTIENESKDRHDVSLPGLQPELLRRACDGGKKKVVVVLFHGGIVTLDPDVLSACPSIVSAGYPGFFGAEAIADAILDAPDSPATNRWGRLPVTWYSKDGWAKADLDMLDFDMGAGAGRTHRYYTGWPLFSFGHGLTYVAAESLTADVSSSARPDGAVDLMVRIANAGGRDVDEVVFLYARAGGGVVPRSEPAARLVSELVGFERVSVTLGGVARVDFVLGPEALRLYDSTGRRKLFEGAYGIAVEWSGGRHILAIECTTKGCVVLSPTKWTEEW